MQDEQKKEREVSVASDVTVLEMANVTPQSVACCRSPLAQPPLAPDNVESEEMANIVTVLEMANITPQVKVAVLKVLIELEMVKVAVLKVLIEHETDESVKAVVAPALQGDLDVTALKEKLKAGWTAQM